MCCLRITITFLADSKAAEDCRFLIAYLRRQSRDGPASGLPGALLEAGRRWLGRRFRRGRCSGSFQGGEKVTVQGARKQPPDAQDKENR